MTTTSTGGGAVTTEAILAHFQDEARWLDANGTPEVAMLYQEACIRLAAHGVLVEALEDFIKLCDAFGLNSDLGRAVKPELAKARAAIAKIRKMLK